MSRLGEHDTNFHNFLFKRAHGVFKWDPYHAQVEQLFCFYGMNNLNSKQNFLNSFPFFYARLPDERHPCKCFLILGLCQYFICSRTSTCSRTWTCARNSKSATSKVYCTFSRSLHNLSEIKNSSNYDKQKFPWTQHDFILLVMFVN